MVSLDGRVVIVTGAGRGVGRAHALQLAAEGAAVVVNDVGSSALGEGRDETPGQEVVEVIRARGGEAVADFHDISDWEQARELVSGAVERFGRLDGLVNNAGISGWEEIADATERFVDDTIRVHLKGTIACTRHACNYWRSRGESNGPRGALVNTTSENGLAVIPRRAFYAAAKAGIAMFTLATSLEGAEYGVRANAVAPTGLTRMVREAGIVEVPDSLQILEADQIGVPTTSFPGNSSPLVAWLLSDASADVTGQVYRFKGSSICLAEPWSFSEPVAPPTGVQWTVDEIDAVLAPALFGSGRGARYAGGRIALPEGHPGTLRQGEYRA
jgi:NAD(P)-dependent dehydrogenase (short-subunit alcohol dehydrogenase family)